jgi:NAD(P)-dependent dehydrogenase (short-subunit alcohol dehydrogenase family)
MLDGKVIIITGAASGMGRSAASIFAAAGAKVLLADRSAEAGKGVAQAVRDAGGAAHFHQTDVSDESAVQAMVAAAIDTFGRLDGAFNNAGVPMQLKLLPDLTRAEYQATCDINQGGVFLCMKYEIDAMRRTGGGAIVNNSSAAGQMAVPYAAEYIASKHAVVGLTRAGSAEARQTGVRVNAILPGNILTPMLDQLNERANFFSADHTAWVAERHSIGRFGQPEDVARAAKWLLSDESAFINGVCLPVDGGFLAR